jgi:hypothetical protein
MIGEPRLCAHPSGAGSKGPWKLMTNANTTLIIAHMVRVVGLIRSASEVFSADKFNMRTFFLRVIL